MREVRQTEREKERERNDSCERLGESCSEGGKARRKRILRNARRPSGRAWLEGRRGRVAEDAAAPLGVGVAYATAGVDGRGGSARSVSLEGAPQGGSIVLQAKTPALLHVSVVRSFERR